VSDGTAAVISAAVKAVVRNSFMGLSYTLSPRHRDQGTIYREHCSGRNWSASKFLRRLMPVHLLRELFAPQQCKIYIGAA
jgi:hypothetical protein